MSNVPLIIKFVIEDTGIGISDEQINEILDEAKIKINESKFEKAQIKTDEILAKEIIDKFEYEQALKKRNLADNNMKAIDIYQKIISEVSDRMARKIIGEEKDLVRRATMIDKDVKDIVQEVGLQTTQKTPEDTLSRTVSEKKTVTD